MWRIRLLVWGVAFAAVGCQTDPRPADTHVLNPNGGDSLHTSDGNLAMPELARRIDPYYPDAPEVLAQSPGFYAYSHAGQRVQLKVFSAEQQQWVLRTEFSCGTSNCEDFIEAYRLNATGTQPVQLSQVVPARVASLHTPERPLQFLIRANSDTVVVVEPNGEPSLDAIDAETVAVMVWTDTGFVETRRIDSPRP